MSEQPVTSDRATAQRFFRVAKDFLTSVVNFGRVPKRRVATRRQWWLVVVTCGARPDDFREQADRTCLQISSYVVGSRLIAGLICGGA
jgi:hypothetical protein